MTARKLVRAMKARRSGPVSCGHWVLAGSPIVRVDDRWMCLPCRLERVRASAAVRQETKS